MIRKLLPTLALGSLPLFSACSVEDVARAEHNVDTLILEGRARLDAGDSLGAREVFEKAHRGSPSFRSRMWLIRSWIAEDRNNDALDAIDRLRDAPREPGDPDHELELDYLYGMAFAVRARNLVASGVADASVRMNFLDSQVALQRVVEADGARFRDAYLWLARSAWANGDLEAARPAAERAVQEFPEKGAAWLALGRIAMAQFVRAKSAAGDGATDGWPAEASVHWERAEVALRTCVDVMGFPGQDPGHDEDRKILARAALELGHALSWKERYDEASAAYAQAMTYAPEGTDYAALHDILRLPGEPREDGTLPPQRTRPAFLHALEGANLAVHARLGEGAPEAGELSWWLGWERFQAGRLRAAEQAFRQCVAERPGTANAWFFIAMCRYAEEDWDGTTRALRTGFELDPVAIVAEMRRGDAELNVAKLDWVIARLRADRRVDRAVLSEICAETAETEPRHWNNMGLFLRDEAERIRDDPEQEELHAFLCREALRAYRRALAVAPLDPQLLNDTALILHYYLEDELELAKDMYERAVAEAERQLRGELSADDRRRFETARDDAAANLVKLHEKLSHSNEL